MGTAIKASNEMMASMSKLMSLPETMEMTRQLAYEMESAGLMQEMMDG